MVHRGPPWLIHALLTQQRRAFSSSWPGNISCLFAGVCLPICFKYTMPSLFWHYPGGTLLYIISCAAWVMAWPCSLLFISSGTTTAVGQNYPKACSNTSALELSLATQPLAISRQKGQWASRYERPPHLLAQLHGAWFQAAHPGGGGRLSHW